ncbi:unnamed protein product [Candidula unifasciata]|uniref:Apoptogenic protein 1, mitochondrial n=1 Tax=Candidula unifasciata TaxID=100452 RepID=A0A8S3ZV34_9EUPU|nr:unnamed protein product [Candidula unifasciata]
MTSVIYCCGFRHLTLKTQPVCVNFVVRCLATERPGRQLSKQEPRKLKITPVPPPSGLTDAIGPPDSISNIRPIQFYVPPDETHTEKDFRLQRQEVLEWNKQFWTDHNSRFFQEKEEYVQAHQAKDSEGNIQKLSPEEMSVFYKTFLNKNWHSHLNYNKEWYKKNVSLLWPAFKVLIIRLTRKMKKT